jgi:F-type H+-transporting ATPase subunit c
LATGLAAIGPGLGSGLVAQAGCEGTARNPEQAQAATNTMLLGQAIAQTTAIYGLLVSFILIFKSFPASDLLAPTVGLLSAGICVGIGAIGPGIGVAMAARSAVAWIPRNPTITNELIRTMLIGAAVAESTGIYALVISLVLIFVV